MRDRRLERRLRRINSDLRLPRAVPALILVGVLTAALLARPAEPTLLVMLVAGVIAAAVWLSGYDRARPRAGVIVREIVLGAFLGGCAAGLAIDFPVSARDWLRAPAENGAPAAAFVLVVAILEDLVRGVLCGQSRDR